MYGWIAGIALCLVIGFGLGREVGLGQERGYIAQSCKLSGGFHYKRTGFKCERVTR